MHNEGELPMKFNFTYSEDRNAQFEKFVDKVLKRAPPRDKKYADKKTPVVVFCTDEVEK